MDAGAQLEATLDAALRRAEADAPPPTLAAAMRYAVFPGGARVRPQLCLAVSAAAGGGTVSREALGAAAAIELLHCASLVHDDLPCFDDADSRRGKPSVHHAFGEPIAVLTGDALIVAAFETLAWEAAAAPAGARRLAGLTGLVARAVGMPCGIVAGQAWESEPNPDLGDYQRAKTGALFTAATMAGAVAAGADPARWRALGEFIGEAYQVADDLLDASAAPEQAEKPVGRDAALGRPNAVLALGVAGAVARLESLLSSALASIPACNGITALRALVSAQAKRLAPDGVIAEAAQSVTAQERPPASSTARMAHVAQAGDGVA